MQANVLVKLGSPVKEMKGVLDILHGQSSFLVQNNDQDRNNLTTKRNQINIASNDISGGTSEKLPSPISIYWKGHGASQQIISDSGDK